MAKLSASSSTAPASHRTTRAATSAALSLIKEDMHGESEYSEHGRGGMYEPDITLAAATQQLMEIATEPDAALELLTRLWRKFRITSTTSEIDRLLLDENDTILMRLEQEIERRIDNASVKGGRHSRHLVHESLWSSRDADVAGITYIRLWTLFGYSGTSSPEFLAGLCDLANLTTLTLDEAYNLLCNQRLKRVSGQTKRRAVQHGKSWTADDTVSVIEQDCVGLMRSEPPFAQRRKKKQGKQSNSSAGKHSKARGELAKNLASGTQMRRKTAETVSKLPQTASTLPKQGQAKVLSQPQRRQSPSPDAQRGQEHDANSDCDTSPSFDDSDQTAMPHEKGRHAELALAGDETSQNHHFVGFDDDSDSTIGDMLPERMHIFDSSECDTRAGEMIPESGIGIDDPGASLDDAAPPCTSLNCSLFPRSLDASTPKRLDTPTSNITTDTFAIIAGCANDNQHTENTELTSLAYSSSPSMRPRAKRATDSSQSHAKRVQRASNSMLDTMNIIRTCFAAFSLTNHLVIDETTLAGVADPSHLAILSAPASCSHPVDHAAGDERDSDKRPDRMMVVIEGSSHERDGSSLWLAVTWDGQELRLEKSSEMGEDNARRRMAALMHALQPGGEGLVPAIEQCDVSNFPDRADIIWWLCMRKLADVYHAIDVSELDDIPNEVLRSTVTACATVAEGGAMPTVELLACLGDDHNTPAMEVGDISQICERTLANLATEVRQLQERRHLVSAAHDAVTIVAVLAKTCADSGKSEPDLLDKMREQQDAVDMLAATCTQKPSNASLSKLLDQARTNLARLQANANEKATEWDKVKKIKQAFCNAGIEILNEKRVIKQSSRKASADLLRLKEGIVGIEQELSALGR